MRDRLAREKQLPVADALRIARDVADALDHAHAHGVVHRDIKPGNILLEDGHAVVADFGIARAVSAVRGEALTETGLSVGTPLYMSPEQAVGEPNLDGRSDQYSLACVLYEMLVGQPPFTGATAQAILARRLTDAPPSLRAVRESVPADVERAIARALSRTPADRFPTAREFGAALRPAERPAGTSARRLLMITAAGVAPIAIVWAALAVLRQPTGVPLDRGLMAVLPFRVSGTDSCTSSRHSSKGSRCATDSSGNSGFPFATSCAS